MFAHVYCHVAWHIGCCLVPAHLAYSPNAITHKPNQDVNNSWILILKESCDSGGNQLTGFCPTLDLVCGFPI